MFTGQKVNIQKVLGLIPEDLLSKLAIDTKVDYCSKVLYGERIFNLLLYGLLTTDRTSQRTLEDIFGSDLFKTLFNYDAGMKVAHSSISTRLSNIDTEFFRLAYEKIYVEFSKFFSQVEQLKYKITRVDSSMIAETCNKLKEGLSPGSKKANNKPSVKQIKFTAAFDGLTVCSFDVFTDSKYTSEDKAIPEVLLKNATKENKRPNIYTFDRGVAASKTFAKLNEKELYFVGRLKTNRKFEIVSTDSISDVEKDMGELILVSSQLIHLYKDDKIDKKNTYRLIIAERKDKIDTTPPNNIGKVRKKENTFYFFTNNMELTPKEISSIYKQRWDIEVFFRFIKQELNASHFISVSKNGITVMLYMTLIAAMLLQLYKKLNDLGYKTAKRRFTMELWETLIAVIVKECGGNPELINKGYFKHMTIP
jgi:hypothetical protein